MSVMWEERGENAVLAERLGQTADLVEMVPPPREAVLRGGRRRRARRRAAIGTSAVAAVACAGLVAAVSGVLPLNGPMNGRDNADSADASGTLPEITVPPPPDEQPEELAPVTTVLGSGTASGEEFTVSVEVWAEADTPAVAWDQYLAMHNEGMDQALASYLLTEPTGEAPANADTSPPFELDQTWHFVSLDDDFVTVGAPENRELQSAGGVVGRDLGTDESTRLVAGWVPADVVRVEYDWENGTVSEPELVSPPGSQWQWFALAGPEGVDSASMETFMRDGDRAEVDSPEFD